MTPSSRRAPGRRLSGTDRATLGREAAHGCPREAYERFVSLEAQVLNQKPELVNR